MKVISLFAGIGGFDLAAEQIGWETVATCEISELPREVLKSRFPNAYHHDDIKTLTYEKLNEKITKTFGTRWRADGLVLVGGFPCQPYSNAGKRLGTEDDRHLWPQMLRIISEAQPEWVIGENVRGLVSWNAGMVFEQVQADLEAQGYEVWPFLLPACAVNAPHRRDRIWFVAHAIGSGTGSESGQISNKRGRTGKDWGKSIRQAHGQTGTSGINPTSADERLNTNSHSHGQQRGNGNNEIIPSEGGFNALGNACKSIEDGIATNTTGGSKQGKLQQRQREGEFGGCNSETYTYPTNTGIESERPKRENSIHGFNTPPHPYHRCRPCDTIQAGREIFEVLPWGQWDAADTDNEGCKWNRTFPVTKRQEQISTGYRNNVPGNAWQNFPTQSPICGGDDGLPGELVRAYVIKNSGGLLTEKEVNTIVSKTIEAFRKANIQAYGNAVVPPLVRQIMKAINKFNWRKP